MAIIRHRFIQRLLPGSTIPYINTLIIGTFNPGIPRPESLSEAEAIEFNSIANTEKFKTFNQVLNFYDRPQNRFWKVMDVINSPDFYQTRSINEKNIQGIKYYSGMNRSEVFERQQLFCQKHGVFITDIVSEIATSQLEPIYTNFSDIQIDKVATQWNTDGIVSLIDKYKPKKIVINLGLGSSIPNISSEISKIKDSTSNEIYHALSTSGAAGNSYVELIHQWQQFFQ